MIDRANTKCTECTNGTYSETSLHDDWNGVSHCSKCNHQITTRHTNPATTSNYEIKTTIDLSGRHMLYEAYIDELPYMRTYASTEKLAISKMKEYIMLLESSYDRMGRSLPDINGR